MPELHGLEGPLLSPLSPSRAKWIAHGLLAYGRDGVIAHSGPRKNIPGLKPKRIPNDCIIIPGLIDCHSHLSQHQAVGRTGFTLLGWLKKNIYPAELRLAVPREADRASRDYLETLLANGVTCAALYTNFHQGVQAAHRQAKRCGIRALIGYTLMDRGVPARLKQLPDQAIGKCRELAALFREDHAEGRLFFSLNPRFAPACSPGFLESIGRLARQENLFIQTHLSENLQEVGQVKRNFPGAKSYAGVYDRFGLLTPKTLLAHCIHLSPAERRMVADRECAVIHCPSSNLFLHSGRFPLEYWTGYPKLALGSDLAAGPSPSMLEVMRDGYYANLQRLSSLFYMATLGAAQSLGMDDSLGSLEPGKQADFSIVRLKGLETDRAEPLLARMIFQRGKFVKTFISGQQIWPPRGK